MWIYNISMKDYEFFVSTALVDFVLNSYIFFNTGFLFTQICLFNKNLLFSIFLMVLALKR